MKKKYVVAFLATFFFILAISIITLAQPATATPIADSFGAGDASGDTGTYVVVPVTINATNGPVLGIGFDIAYDKNVINVTNVSKENLVPSNWADPNVNNNFAWGTKITIAGFYAADAIPDRTSGTVVLLNFHVIGSPGDTSPMNMTFIELANPDGITGTAPARNGTFTVTGEPTPTPTPSNGGGSMGGGGGYVPPTTPAPTPAVTPMPTVTPAPAATPTVPLPAATSAQTPTSTPAPVPGLPPLFLILIVIAVIVIEGIIIIVMRK